MPSRKESLSNLDIRLMVRELQKFKRGFLQKLYQPQRDTLLLRLYSKEAGKGELLINLGSHLCLRKEVPENPIRPSQFIMQARKLLANAIIRDIRQQGFDRIVIFELEKRQKRFLLIFEMFGTGNVALVDKETGTIIRPLIPKSWKDRELRAKRPYQFPPSQPELPGMTKEEFANLMNSSDKDLIRTLTLDLKMEGNLAEEIVARSSFSKATPAQDLGVDACGKLYEEMGRVFEGCVDEKGGGEGVVAPGEEVSCFSPAVVYKQGTEGRIPFDVIPFKYSIYETPEFEVVEKQDFNSCVVELFPLPGEGMPEQKKQAEKKHEEGGASEEQYRSEVLKKLHKRLKLQEASIASLEEKILASESKANQIFINYKKYEALLEELKRNMVEKGGERFKEKVESGEIDVLKDVDLKNSCLAVKFPEDEHWLTLCWKENLNQNAQRYYANIKKMKKKTTGAKKAVLQSYQEIERAKKRSMKEEIKRAEQQPSKKEQKDFWFERYRWFLSSEGNIVVAGKDAKTNEIVVKKYLREDDRYVHADYHGAASVVVKKKEDEKDVGEDTLNEAASFAASFSRAWSAKVSSVPAYWVKPEQVSKTPNPGEFLAKGAFVIRGKRNFIGGEMKLAVGEIEYQNKRKLVAGPVSAMETQAQRYLLIQPGSEKRENVAKKLSRLFKYSTDYTQRLVPGDSLLAGGNFDWKSELEKFKKGGGTETS